MKRALAASVAMGAAMAAAGAFGADTSNRPDWAYAIPVGQAPARTPEDGKMFGLTGAARQFTSSEIRGVDAKDPNILKQPADWYPNEHPAMPKIVAEGDNGRKIAACSLCHYPNGKGRTENAPPAGQPAEYIERQLHDFRDGLRKSADPRKANTNRMVDFAKAMTDDEIKQSAAYFSSMKWTPWIRVVETNTIPKSRSVFGMWMAYEGAEAGSEPLGMRVIESPENSHATDDLRDPHSGFVAYVPVGALAKGKDLVTTGGNGKTTACTLCHGADLHGIGSVPDIAGRSPAYIARQLYDIQAGTRHGGMTAMMQPVVAKLTNEDFVDITGYLASLPTQAPAAPRSTAAK